MATRSSTKCPWRNFHKCIIKYMNILHMEACKPQMKIDKFVYTMRHNFPSPTMDLEKDEKSTKQLQGSKESTKQSKRVAQESNYRTKITSNSETDSAYSTESESNHTAHLPRPPSSPKPTRQHLRPSTSSQPITILEEEISSTSTRTCPAPPPRPSKSQQITNTKYIQGTKPSCIPIPKPSTSTWKTSYLSTSTHLQEPSTSAWPNTQTTVRQPILPAPKTSTASTYPQCTRKTPLLPTPPASARNFNYRSHYKQHIPGPPPSPSRYSIYSTFSGPVTNNYSYYLQPHIPGPHTTNPLYLHQEFFTRPYQQMPLLPLPALTGPCQQISGHFPQQVYYLPVILLHPLQHYTI